uniref:Uncharacterized protein n=1 Tax=Cannabis sativa TaxID=3483 RepID=A0A803P9Y4_CANSA
MAAELVGGALLSALINPLVEKLASEVKDFFKGKDVILKQLKELKTLLSAADLLLTDAEEKLIKDQAVRKWLDDLKDAIYDADDLAHKIETKAWRNQLEGESHCCCSCTSKVLMKLISSTRLTSFDKAIKPEIEETLGKLKLLLDNKDLGLKRLEKYKLPERVCAPSLEESDIYGRDHEKEEIIKLLLSDETTGGDKLSVIPIVGMGGIGKTTLAQLVFKDARVNKTFDTKVWITVGDDKVDCMKVMKLIVEKVTSRKCEIEEQYDLQEEVKKVLSVKKFLFVVDDVWDEDPSKWDVLNNCLKSGLHGSRIIVTTRSTVVASIMKTGSTYQLGRINEVAGWQLFAKHASLVVDSNDYLDLKQVGEKIIDKCKGLPLAIKSIGDLLRGTRNKEEWESILNNDIWELYERKQVEILPALWLSYFHLPSELKQCFAYCSLFPKDYHFKKGEMVLLWMAEDLLQPTNGKRIENVGEEYFRDLISKSFFQPSTDQTFLMHDLVHDLAMFVSGEFSLTINNINKCSHKVRHFSSLQVCVRGIHFTELEELFKAKYLRTILWKECLTFDQLMIERLDKSFPSLRVLSISDYRIPKLPDSIGNLKYLRYLKLDSPDIKEIPNTICKLYNLETLLLEYTRVTRLHTDIGSLIKLRHLSVPKYSLQEMPLQLGKLQNLQTLNAFVVGRSRDCGGIKLLKEFQDLHESLSIRGLENVSSLEEVSDAAPLLKSKKFLSQLSLEWSRNREPEVDELHKERERELLSALQPHPNLKELGIRNYKGNSFPNWMGDHRCLSNLVSLQISHCSNCSFLPSLGQLPCLKELVIDNLYGVVRIGSEFYYSATSVGSSSVAIQTKPLFFRSLETLKFNGLYILEEWSLSEGGVFPRLKNLHLKSCYRLKVTLLGDYFPSLTELVVGDSEELIPSLLPKAQLMQAPLISLKKIVLSLCFNLKCLDEAAFQHLTSLEELTIEGCPNLRLQRETGEDWPIIAHIPNIIVDKKKI